MPEKTKIGEGMLDYIFTLDFMGKRLQEAIEKAGKLLDNLSNNYEGDALEEMELFLYGLTTQSLKLLQLYNKMQAYTAQTYETFYHNDQLMTDYMRSRGLLEG